MNGEEMPPSASGPVPAPVFACGANKSSVATDIFTHIADSLLQPLGMPGAADADLIFMGSKSAGKSTLIHAFLQKDEGLARLCQIEY